MRALRQQLPTLQRRLQAEPRANGDAQPCAPECGGSWLKRRMWGGELARHVGPLEAQRPQRIQTSLGLWMNCSREASSSAMLCCQLQIVSLPRPF
jgi:hypothetical protein